MTLSTGACGRSDEDRAQIYQASLEHLRATGELTPDMVLVAESTRSSPMAGTPLAQRLAECFRGAPDLPQLAASLGKENEVPSPVPGELGQMPAVTLIPAELYRRDAKGRFSKQLLERYGQKRDRYYVIPGLLAFSNVGLGSKRALVAVDYDCTLCGFGMYLLLENERGWSVVDSCVIWVS